MAGLIRSFFLGFALWSSLVRAGQADPLSTHFSTQAQRSKRSDVIVQLTHNLQDGFAGGASPQSPFHGVITMTGPASRLANLHQDSGWRIVDCTNDRSQYQTALAYCTKGNLNEGCGDIFMGGPKHTIVMLPQGCGASPFAHVVSFQPTNRPLPKSEKIHGGDATVYELRFDYDFRSIPYKHGEIPTALHIEASNIKDYTSVPGFGTERSYEAWLQAITNVTTAHGHHTLSVDKHFSANLADMSQKCKGFTMDLAIETVGNVGGGLSFGYYFRGTINPPVIDEQYVYLDASAKAKAKTTITGIAEYIFKEVQIPILPPISLPGLSYPGLLDLGPYFEILAGLKGGVSVSGNITTNLGFTIPSVKMSLGNGHSPVTAEKSTDFASVVLGKDLQVAAGLTVYLGPQIGVQVNVLSGVIDADVALRPTAGIAAGGETKVGMHRRNVKRSPKLKHPCLEVDGSVDLYWIAAGQLGPWGKSIEGHIWGIQKKLWAKCWKSVSASMTDWELVPGHPTVPPRAKTFSSMKCPPVAPFGN